MITQDSGIGFPLIIIDGAQRLLQSAIRNPKSEIRNPKSLNPLNHIQLYTRPRRSNDEV
ncbi:hypothetical protein D1AOALGA4SA_5846 [Olavius algarvensis Delta 1 endosymbiont]|nr:hypothetical protein D1AOALGA4SA_5846 [Olavius algarvensis Delta 1 endosymbiont]